MIAGGIADWGKCVALLESNSLHSISTTELTYRDNLPLPPQHLYNVEACIDCGPSSDVFYLSLSWQAALHSALESAVASSLSTLSIHQAPPATPGAVESDDAKMQRDDEVLEPQDTRNNQTSKQKGVACRMCYQETVSLFLTAKGVLVCKSCRIHTR